MAFVEHKEEHDDAEAAQRLVAHLEAGDNKFKTSLRRHQRITYFRRVELILLAQADQPRVTAYTRNLSPGGLGLLSRRVFNLGERFVTLLTMGGERGKYMLCRVTFCRYLSDCLYEIGAAFEATTPYLNQKQRIPKAWVSAARDHAPPCGAAGILTPAQIQNV